MEIWCFDCENVFDDQQGHHCVHGWINPKNVYGKNANFPTTAEKIYCVSRLNSNITTKESSCQTSVTSEVENAEKIDNSEQTSFNIDTMQFFHSSPESTPEKMSDQFLIVNYEQSNLEDYSISETDGLTLSFSNQVFKNDYNLPLESSIRNSQIVVDNCGKNDNRSQFSSFEESSMANSGNKHSDFNMPSMNVDSLMLNKTGLKLSSKVHPQKINVKKDRLLSKDSHVHRQERKLNTEFESTINVPNNEMVSKSRQVVHDQEYELEKMSCPVTIKDNAVNQQLKSSNMSTVEVTKDFTITVSLTSDENELTFGKGFYQVDQNQTAETEFVKNHTKALIQPCYTDAISAVFSPSRSLDSERSYPICLKEFRTKTTLKQHNQIHSGEKPFTCNICQQKFTQRGALNRHEREVHTDEKPHKCENCGNGFTRKNGLKKHIRVHIIEKPYKCDICGKLFGRKDVLDRHIRTHTGEKPYKCGICKRAFAEKHHLIDHVRSRHKVT